MADKKKYTSKVEPLQIFPLIGPQGGGGKPSTVKGTKIRKEYAQYKKAHHLRTKIEKAKSTRIKEATQAKTTTDFYKKYPGSKDLFAKQKYSKSILRKEKQLKKVASKSL